MLETFQRVGHLNFLCQGNLGFPEEGMLGGKRKSSKQTYQELMFYDPTHWRRGRLLLCSPLLLIRAQSPKDVNLTLPV